MSGCAFTGPPHPAPPTPPPPPPCPVPALSLVEGQPRGLMLDASWAESLSAECPTAVSVVLLRAERRADQTVLPWASHYTFELTPSQSRFLDQELVPGTTYRYLLAVADADQRVIVDSPQVEVTWRAPVDPPTDVEVSAVGRHVHLAWRAEGERLGALIFRRHLGHGGFERRSAILPAGTETFLDVEIEPGGIYTYIISSVAFEGHAPLIGPPGPEVYVEATLDDEPDDAQEK